MLVLSRRKGQVIRIGDDIEIVVTACHRSSVKLAIRAPETLFVRRGEVDEAGPPGRDSENEPLESGGVVHGERLPAGDTGTVSSPRTSVSREEGGSHPALDDARAALLILLRARSRRGARPALHELLDLFEELKKALTPR